MALELSEEKLTGWLCFFKSITEDEEDEDRHMHLPDCVRDGWLKRGWVTECKGGPDWNGVVTLHISDAGRAVIFLNSADWGFSNLLTADE